MEATELFVKFLIPHGGGYLRQRGLQRSSCSKSRLTASLTRSVLEVLLPVRTVRRSASRSSAAISSGGRETVTGLSLLLLVGGLPRVAMCYPPLS
jgi:hypothetical protein